MFYVAGAEFTDTSFQVFDMNTLETHGPYETYGEAMKKWRERSWATVDNCHFRFSIYENYIPFVKEIDHGNV